MDHLENSAQFTDRLAGVIVDWPLYKTFSFTGDVRSLYVTTAEGPIPGHRSIPYVTFPSEISMSCPQCDHELRWALQESPSRVQEGAVFAINDQFTEVIYRCKNCGAESIYFLRMLITGTGGTVTKVGQYPALEREPSKVLASAMTDDDVRLYKKALTSRNSNYGIGAVAYLRRIVENRINDLLDLIAEAAEAAEPNSPVVERLTEMKGEKRFSDKIEYAAEMLPSSLRRGGHNPIATLHDLASDGLHAKSDEECVEIFDRCKLAFEYVIRRLKEDQEEDASYQQAIKSISVKRASKEG